MHSRRLASILEVASLLNGVLETACLAIAPTKSTISYPTALVWLAAMLAILTVVIPALKWASDIVLPSRIEPPHSFDEGGLSAEEIRHLIQFSPLLYKALAFVGVFVGIVALAFGQPGGSLLDGDLTSRDLVSIGGALLLFSSLVLPVHGSIARWKS